ncbi:MAG: DUF1538 domain-containing protein [Dehalococcoidaceae bacterium]|nr:DUF1538 domain-containing protein [Dehalococcoidaceae bacterium]
MSGLNLFHGFGGTIITVLKSVVPIVAFFIIFQLIYLRLPWRYLARIFFGVLLTLAGVAIFLQGVKAGFYPAGTEIGTFLGAIHTKWLLVPFGVAMGFLATFGEPAVRVLSYQVEKASGGSIRSSLVLYGISMGVALFVGLGMARIVWGIPLNYIVIPGYILAIILMFASDKTAVSIAFDSGGVATGPMAVTFLLAVAVGITSSIEGRDPVADGFGLISLIALAPILFIMLAGLYLKIRLKRRGEQNGNG